MNEIDQPRFNGADYDPVRDNARLGNQYERIWRCMRDGGWRTLAEIELATGDPPASISAQLRHMRKPRFGAHTINRRHRGQAAGTYEYQLQVNAEPVQLTLRMRA